MKERTIRFITSRYEELFQIIDGGTVRVSYPDCAFLMKCRYVDDYHLYWGKDLKELDGGQLDNPDFTLKEARDEILSDMRWDACKKYPATYEELWEDVENQDEIYF